MPIPHPSMSGNILTDLAEDEVHIYISELEKNLNSLDSYRNLLSEEEIEKSERYLFLARKNTFLLSRGKLRSLLSHYAALKAEEIQFEYTENQKPFIADKQVKNNPLYFNISHSRDYVLHAFSRRPLLGIDIEYKRTDRPFIALADRFYTPLENQQLQKSDNMIETFYRLWALKEAYLKSQGTGISGGLKNIEFILDDIGKKPVLNILNSDSGYSPLHAEEIFIHPDYQSAIVCAVSSPHLLLFRDTSR